MTPETKSLILDLFAIQAVKFGTFTLKSGIQSPIYFDLRVVISYPVILKNISNALGKLMAPLPCDLICGVPYTALPIATAISLERSIPMVMRRKEAKDYGTKKLIEGKFEKGQTCLIIEDVVTSGASILETAAPLKAEGLEIEDAVVVLNREQGGKERLKENGIELHSLISVFTLLKVLFHEKKIPETTFREVNEFLEQSFQRSEHQS
jgi:uridine monophosphate synthetase